MFGTTKDFLDYFGLKKLEELPTLADIKDGLPELSPQTDLVESLEVDARGVDVVLIAAAARTCRPALRSRCSRPTSTISSRMTTRPTADDDSDLAGPDLVAEDSDDDRTREAHGSEDDADDAEAQTANVIPLRAADDEQ